MKTSKQRTLSKGKVKIYWEDYINDIYELAKTIKKSKIKFKYVCGIPRGGLIPATIISHELKIDMITEGEIYEGFAPLRCKILFIDDICDSGKTISMCKSTDITLHYKPYTATIYKHKDSPVTPDFYVYENTKWLIFPYEKE